MGTSGAEWDYFSSPFALLKLDVGSLEKGKYLSLFGLITQWYGKRNKMNGHIKAALRTVSFGRFCSFTEGCSKVSVQSHRQVLNISLTKKLHILAPVPQSTGKSITDCSRVKFLIYKCASGTSCGTTLFSLGPVGLVLHAEAKGDLEKVWSEIWIPSIFTRSGFWSVGWLVGLFLVWHIQILSAAHYANNF